MKKRWTRKTKNKRNKQIVLFGLITLVFLMVCGYAAFNTELSLRAKGNIIERMTSEKLKNDFCNTEFGDGLYKDIYEDGKCFYKGINPNNYIIFNNEMWRIISIESDNAIKIMRNGSIRNMQWGYSSRGNDWIENSQINPYLNNDYYNSITVNLDKIVSYNFNIGAVTSDSSITENDDLQSQINEEKSKLWNGKIGLITASDYLRANSNITQCSTNYLNNQNNKTCLTTNWIYNIASKGNFMWTITAVNRISYSDMNVFTIYTDNINSGQLAGAGRLDYSQGVVPCLYLSSDITLSGTGTENDPYRITN